MHDREAESDEWTNQQVFYTWCCLLVETWHQPQLGKYDKYSVELRDTKVANLVQQVKSGVVGVVKWAPQPSSYRCTRLMFEAIHGQTFQNNNCQILTELEIDKNVHVLGPKLDAKEI